MPEPKTPEEPRQSALDWALYYAARGWSVVPVRPPEKLPAVQWARRQTLPATEADIRAWWDERPDFGVGLVQGKHVGTVVLDFDGEDGARTRAQLEARGLPLAPTSLTGSGGAHMIIRHPGRHVPTRKKVLPGMDVRGDGGFIVAPPSVHGIANPYGGYTASGARYVWDCEAHPDDVSVPDCPEWLADIICGEVAASTDTAAEVVRVQRASGTIQVAETLVADGRETYMRDTILAVLREERDRLGRMPDAAELFDAAWPQYAKKVDFSRPGRGSTEFRAKVAYTLNRAQRGAIAGFETSASTTLPDDSDKPKAEAEENAKPATPLPLIYWNDVQANTDTADFVEGLLIEGAMSIVYGESNAGKTFFVTDLAAHVATGTAWRGRAIEAGGVIYCALEGSHGIGNRVAAFKKAHNLEGVEVPFAIIPVSINLLDPNADRTRLVETVKAAAEEMGCPVKLIVIDTLSRAMAGGNENAPDDMGALVASADFIRQAVKAHVCFIHHSGKDAAKGARGHSLLRAATDTEIEVARVEGAQIATVRVTKQRDMEKAEDMAFRLEQVELGTNRRGKPVTSCIVRPADTGDAPPPQARERKLPDNAQFALDVLVKLLGACGRLRAGLAAVPGHVPTVTYAEWEAAYCSAKPGVQEASAKKALDRACEPLRNRKLAFVKDGFAWIP